MESLLGETLTEIRHIAKGANVVEGHIFDIKHRKDTNYQKFVQDLKEIL